MRESIGPFIGVTFREMARRAVTWGAEEVNPAELADCSGCCIKVDSRGNFWLICLIVCFV